ncbi:3-hydroxyacyl-CoA dehydrogenase NAD-binding domain-containing protein [Bacillus sp. V5-8f]|uniref:3-hydroxyacyl-CoA dehydrogenase NAD-binding domain-containing protein n=1 Tax=Bacillus sp. V5-8f TaxID=2053044 RepID=UPI000C7928DA|nr:3-hydroxybutyryl-CoA dehydrogenase [Bacillus sp. V5-8f]
MPVPWDAGVVLQDVHEGIIERGLQEISNNIQRGVHKNKISQQEADQIFECIEGTIDFMEVSQADVVIEAITEKMEAKKELFKELDTVCKPAAIFASNTSGLSITEMASATKRPEQVIGTHFFYPVPRMELVELVRGHKTSDQCYETTKQFIETLRKKEISVKETPLFVVNRILIPMVNEAIFVLAEGTASAEEIDVALKLGAHHPIGPLALADVIGLDTLLHVIETLFTETGDPKYRPSPLLKKMVRAGTLGRKTGVGFFTY